MPGFFICNIRYADKKLFHRGVHLLPKATTARFETLLAQATVKHTKHSVTGPIKGWESPRLLQPLLQSATEALPSRPIHAGWPRGRKAIPDSSTRHRGKMADCE